MGNPITPVYVEKATGDELAPTLEKEYGGRHPDARLQVYVTFVGKRLLPSFQRKDVSPTFALLASDKIVNAFALGNGNVYITKALLNLLDDEAELAEIMGHEIAHVEHRHIAKSIDRSLGAGLLLSVAEAFLRKKEGSSKEGDSSLITKALQVVPAFILSGFSRDQELEADSSGLYGMAKAGYDPMGAVRVFQKFQALEPKEKGLEKYFSSHPTAKVRVKDLEKVIRSYFPSGGEAYRDRFQSIVKGSGQAPGLKAPAHMSLTAAGGIAAGLVGATLLMLL